MAAPSGNAVVPEKMHFVGDNDVVAAGRQWFVDERDGFISWIRSEFAAANAIIDALVQHLRFTGDPGEYEHLFGAVQQRRCNWSPVLHMQHYFSIAEVLYALQQAAWRRQQLSQHPRQFEQSRAEENRRPAYTYRQVRRYENSRENHSTLASNGNDGEKADTKPEEAGGGEQKEDACDVAEGEVGVVGNPGSNLDCIGKDERHVEIMGPKLEQSSIAENGTMEFIGDSKDVPGQTRGVTGTIHDDKNGFCVVPKTFSSSEMVDGRMVNVVDGLKLYEKLIDDSEITKLIALANDLIDAGKRGEFQGQTAVLCRRPMKGHGREMIQLGTHMVGSLEDENTNVPWKDRRVEAIPDVLLEVFDHIMQIGVLDVKPDYCIIDFFHEGDHSHPHIWPHWYGRAVCNLILTDCNMVFGRTIVVDSQGDHRGFLQLSLAPGDLLVMQGRSAHIARHAIPSVRRRRIIVTFGKSQPRKIFPSEGSGGGRYPSSQWSPQRVQSPGPPCGVHKHYGAAPSNGSIQPLFVAATPSPSSVPLPPSSAGWSLSVPLAHPAPRMPGPGTGVFLPPSGSGNSPPPPAQLPGESESAPDAPLPPRKIEEDSLDNYQHGPGFPRGDPTDKRG